MLDLNTVVVISLGILAFFSIVLAMILIPIALQCSRTLGSLQNLIDTINNDVKPAVKEIKQSVYGVKDSLERGTNEASIFVASSAYGILTGVKEYLSPCKTNKSSYNSNGNSSVKR